MNMSNPNGEDSRRAARLTAHALGQVDPPERAEVEAELSASAKARETVRIEQALAAQLRKAAQQAPLPERSAELRKAVERRLQELQGATAGSSSSALPGDSSTLLDKPAVAPGPRGRSRWAIPLVAATLLLAAVPAYFFLASRNAIRAARNVAATGSASPAADASHPMPSGVMGSAIHGAEGKQSVEGAYPNYGIPPSDAAKSRAMPATEPPPLEKFEVGEPPKEPTFQDTSPLTLEKPGQREQGEQYSDDGGIFEHKGGGTASDSKDSLGGPGGFNGMSSSPRARAIGNGGGMGLGTGGQGFGVRGSGHRKAMLASGGGTKRSEQLAAAMSKLQSYSEMSGDGKNPTRPKHIETWKPSGLVPNTSRLMVGDNEELPLRGMQVDVRVDGFRARVVLDLYYFNDQPRQLEGNFQLRLPEEAAPYFFAFGRTVYQAPQIGPQDSMFFKREQVSAGDTTPEKILALRGNSWEQPKVARMVAKEKAAYAYRETVRRRVDPALLEWAGAGVFQCRVFPLAPQSLHRVVVGYDVDLVRAGADLELRLDLPERTPACVVDVNIAATSAKQVSLDAPATASADGQRLSYRLVNPRERPLLVRLRKPATTMLVGDDATGSYFAVQLAVPEAEGQSQEGDSPSFGGRNLGQSPPHVSAAKSEAGGAGKRSPSPPAPLPEGEGRANTPLPLGEAREKAIFLVDASLSAGPQFSLWTKLLRAALDNNRDQIQQFAVLFFNVETFWWQEKFVDNTPENVETLMKYADGLALEGATDVGRALGEAAAPSWLKTADGQQPELFLLSDGAATWGEDRGAMMAAALKTARAGPLFAYQTGISGSDPRLLAQLAQATGGAVFAVVGEAEIQRASTAQRQRPWQLTNVEMAGGHDLLLAGRPQCVFPGQQLLLVGRCERGLSSGEVTLTLQQGETTHTVRTKIDRELNSELAARTYGQVAVGQLEDVAASAETVEPIATGYARHFRVTGRTCSLLMLDTEADYVRFHIKPEEDALVVSDQPAAATVAKAAADRATIQSDPKANFLAWFHGLEQSSGVHFDLPASLPVALAGLPPEAFAVTVPPLRCKLHARQELPKDVQEQLAAGGPDYESLTAESQRRLTRYGADDALRALSSLVEEHPGDAAVARDVAFSALEWERPGEAYHLLRRAATGRTFEPIACHALAHCLEQMGQTDLAIIYYELACAGQWDPRFGDMHNIAQLDYFRFLRHLAAGKTSGLLSHYAEARLATLSAAQLRDTADLVALIFWNTDGTDVDLHVTEPGGEECFYLHRETASGGQISRDVTTGYGPEIYILPRAPRGTYQVRANYFATDVNRTSTRTKVFALIYQGWGTKTEKLTCKALTLSGRSEMHDLAKIAVGP
jgi:hypothetical protein